MSVQNRSLVTLSLAGINTGVWETLSGREMDTEGGDTYRPGPGDSQRSLGGPKVFGEITVARTAEDTRDGALRRRLQALGSRASGSLSEQPLDADLNAFDTATVWPVRLKGMSPPDTDVNSGDRKMLEITLFVDGEPS